MTVQRRTPGPRPDRVDPPARVDPPTRFYKPLSAYTGRDEDPDEVVDEWEEALRGDEAQDSRDAAQRAIDPPTRRWTWAVPGASAPRAGSLWDEPDRGASADDSTFAAFSEDPYRTPARRPAPDQVSDWSEPEPRTAPAQPEPAPERPEAEQTPERPEPEAAAEPVRERPAPKPKPTPKPRSESEPKPEPKSQPDRAAAAEPTRPAPEEPERPSAVAEQLFGTYPGVEEHVSTQVIPRIVDDKASPTEAGEPRTDGDTDRADTAHADAERTDVDAERTDADADPATATPSEVEDADAEVVGEHVDAWRESAGRDDDEPAADAEPDDDHARADHDRANSVHAETVRVDLASFAAADPRPAEAEAGFHDEYDPNEGAAARVEDVDLGDTAEWRMDDGVEDGGAVAAPSAREARTELIPRVPGRAGDPTAAGAHARPEAPSRAAEGTQRTMVIVLALLLVTIVAGAAAYICWAKARDAEATRPTGNLAFVDKAVTSQVRDQVSKAVEAIYSYDYTRLDADEQRALSFITGGYADEFKQNFAKVRELGPQQKASLVSTVAEAGVERITDRRATLLLMVNQVGHRADSAAPLKASVRMGVTAERVDGQWKVSETNQR